MKRLVCGGALALALVLSLSCASAPKAVPEGLSSSEIVQKAQEASDLYNYTQAIAYYKSLQERFSGEPAMVCQGEYEIAFIYYKQGKYAESKALFQQLLARYEGVADGSLPARYKILALKVLPVVEAKLSPASTKTPAKTTKK